jgi:uncharacterized protein YdbL (DUF1318 family)
LQQEAKDLNLSLDAIGKIFASKYMDNAPLGSKVQQENGKWLVKK